MDYAFDEFRALLKQVPSDNNVTTYLCALVAELAYHHVPQFEIDDAPKRAKLVVPSDGYRAIMIAGRSSGVLAYLQELDFGFTFVAVDRAVVAVGFTVQDKLFIGYRGTAFLFDWRINLRAPLTPVAHWWSYGRLHRGFTEEAVRISIKIDAELRKRSDVLRSIKEVYLSGHSLGGAVAAISDDSIGRIFDRDTVIRSARMFGAPRYADASYYYMRSGLPMQVKREGDIVPAVPPRRSGYADHPREYDTSGNQYPTLSDRVGRFFLWRAALFLGKAAQPHKMEGYRRALGATCKAKFAEHALSDYDKLTRANVYA